MVSRVNLWTNPGVEVDATGFSVFGVLCSIARDTAAYHRGTAALQVLADTGGGTIGATLSATGLTSGVPYTVSCYASSVAGTNVVGMTVTGNPVVGKTVSLDSVWKRVSVTFVSTATSHSINIIDLAGTFGDEFYLDSFLIEEGPTLRDYFDGSFSGCTWAGTPWASTSSGTFSYDFNVDLRDNGVNPFDITLSGSIPFMLVESWGVVLM